MSQIESGIHDEFDVGRVGIVLFGDSHMLVTLHDYRRAGLSPLGRLAFAESIASHAVEHYRDARVSTVGIAFGRPPAGPAQTVLSPESLFIFVPEYRSDGRVRMALLPPEPP